MNEHNPIQEMLEIPTPRRHFLGQTLGALGLVAGASLLKPGVALAQDAVTITVPPAPGPATQSDIDILTFALGLERLESAFYTQVLAAHAAKSYIPAAWLELVNKISAEETTHVQTLEATLTELGAPLPAAGNFKFPGNVFLSHLAFAWFGYTLEEIGIGAYLGAVGNIKSEKIRRAAASIYGSETRHAALLRSKSGFDFAPRYYESHFSVSEVNALIAPYLV